MSTYTRKALCGVAGACILAGFALPSFADDNKVAHYGDNGIAVNTFGNCVRTKWDAGKDACAPEAAKAESAAAPAPAPRHTAHQLKTEQRTVYFAFNKSDIMESEQHKLNSLAEVLKTDKEVKSVSIVGYADRIGSPGYNEKLSKLRAGKVEDYLHTRGYLNTSLAKVRWVGKSEPVTQCSDKLKRPKLIGCLQKDRRVEVEIEYYGKTK